MSIHGMKEQDVLAWGMVLGVLLEGARVTRSKGEDVEVTVFKEADGFYADYVDIEIVGRRLRLRVDPQPTVTDDLLALRDELGGTRA